MISKPDGRQSADFRVCCANLWMPVIKPKSYWCLEVNEYVNIHEHTMIGDYTGDRDHCRESSTSKLLKTSARSRVALTACMVA